jgi:hypothetical protein
MNIHVLNKNRGLTPLKFPAREVPHAIIEPNLTCNMRCRRCYNLHHEAVKTFEQVKGEIDCALSKRNLDTVSLLGGEPTLHPDIVAIVRYVKSFKLVCQILTNGLIFHDDPGGDLLDRLVEAGVDRFLLHADAGQQRPGVDCEAYRDGIFRQFEQRAVFFGLSITVYPESRGTVCDAMKRYARYKYFDGILVTITGDAGTSVLPGAGGIDEPTLREEHDSIVDGLGIRASTYIPSSIDDFNVRWLLYFYYINHRTAATFYLSPRFGRIFRKAYRFFHGHHFFAATLNPVFFRPAFLCAAFAEIALNPLRLPSLLRLLKGSRFLGALRFHYIVIQSAPEWKENAGTFALCYHCPDATIRNGKLTPVCLADRINPIPSGRYSGDVNLQLRSIVYEHLEETVH